MIIVALMRGFEDLSRRYRPKQVKKARDGAIKMRRVACGELESRVRAKGMGDKRSMARKKRDRRFFLAESSWLTARPIPMMRKGKSK